MPGFARGEANFATHGFIPIIFSNKVLLILDKLCAAFKCVNTDYEGDIRSWGDIVRARQFGSISFNPYTPYTNITYQNVTEAYQDLVIDQADYWAFIVDYMDIQQSDLDVMGGYSDRASVAVRNGVDSSILSVMTAGVSASNTLGSPGIGSVVQLDSGTVFDVFTDLFTFLQQSNATTVTAERPFALVPPAVDAVIQKYRALKWTPNGDETTDGVNSYRFGSFDIEPTTNIPFNVAVPGVSDDYFAVVVGYRYATSFAMQLNTVEAISPFQAQIGDAMRGLTLFGTKVFHPTALAKAIVKTV